MMANQSRIPLARTAIIGKSAEARRRVSAFRRNNLAEGGILETWSGEKFLDEVPLI